MSRRKRRRNKLRPNAQANIRATRLKKRKMRIPIKKRARMNNKIKQTQQIGLKITTNQKNKKLQS